MVTEIICCQTSRLGETIKVRNWLWNPKTAERSLIKNEVIAWVDDAIRRVGIGRALERTSMRIKSLEEECVFKYSDPFLRPPILFLKTW